MRFALLVLIICGYLSGETKAYNKKDAELDYRRISFFFNGKSMDWDLLYSVYDVPFIFSILNSCVVGVLLVVSLFVVNVALAIYAIYLATRPLNRKAEPEEIDFYLENEPVNIDFYAPRPVAFKYNSRFHDKQTMMLPPGDVDSSARVSYSRSEYGSERCRRSDPRLARNHDRRTKYVKQKKRYEY
ncbi:hypothetical protein QR680_006100 [Steinernema hermaphroditum]|uniref:Uncharacterized protein n=1 Tax=Steinernema hermaphroditum TaxID=289476 RepID=A0AA39HWI4_9BILA|nr:hypothetical protein QR680_006100 [Steinernema hermaphroditum]